jgi:hypothetical protein
MPLTVAKLNFKTHLYIRFSIFSFSVEQFMFVLLETKFEIFG